MRSRVAAAAPSTTSVAVATLLVVAATLTGWLIPQQQPVHVALALAGLTALLVAVPLFGNAGWSVVFAYSTLGFVEQEPAPFDLLVPALLVLWLFTRRIRIAPDRTTSFLFVTLGVFSASQFMSALASPFPRMSAEWSAVSVLLAMVAFFTCCVARETHLLNSAVHGYVLGAAVSTAISLAVAFRLFPVIPVEEVMDYGLRLQGFYKDPNVYAPYIILAFLVVMAVPFDRGDQRAWFGFARPFLLILFPVGVFLSYSRGAWAYLLVSMLIYWGLRCVARPNLIPRVATLGVIAAIVCVVAWQAIEISDDSYFASRLSLQEYDEKRFATQARSLSDFVESPLIGQGGGIAKAVWNYDPHNVYLRLMFENGLFGLLSTLLLMGGAMVCSMRAAVAAAEVRHQKMAAVIAAALVAMLLESLIIDSLHWRNLWVLIGLGWGAAIWSDAGALVPHGGDATVKLGKSLPAPHGDRGRRRRLSLEPTGVKT